MLEQGLTLRGDMVYLIIARRAGNFTEYMNCFRYLRPGLDLTA